MGMRHVPLSEFVDRVDEFVAAVDRGEDIFLVHNGRSVARVSASSEREQAIQDIIGFREDLRAKGVRVSQDDWVAWKHEGRD
jgi:antitoxin (DNA-binding transcriptional repressor) of toxin-antitoxin stability system